MTDPSAPPPPGKDTPVPADAAARAAAAGRARAERPASAPRSDALVPTTARQQRAEDRARMRRPGYAPPVSAPPGAAPLGAAPYGGMGYSGMGYSGMGYGGAPYGVAAQRSAGVVGNPAAPTYPVGPWPAYAAGPYASAPLPYGVAPYGVAPYAVYPVVPPRIRWTRKQTGAAILSSWVGQTIMALATHLLVTYFLIVGFAFLLHISGDPVDDVEADSLTSTIALWSMPERVWATVLIGAMLGGAVLALGAIVSAQWAKSAGLAKPHRSTWLAWLCTTATTGFFGAMYWPGAIVFGMIGMVASSSASLTLGSMWSTLFGLLAMAVVLTGGVGLLFGWMFLSTSRPRVDLRAIAAAEEAAARARDEAELTRVRLRGEPG